MKILSGQDGVNEIKSAIQRAEQKILEREEWQRKQEAEVARRMAAISHGMSLPASVFEGDNPNYAAAQTSINYWDKK